MVSSDIATLFLAFHFILCFHFVWLINISVNLSPPPPQWPAYMLRVDFAFFDYQGSNGRYNNLWCMYKPFSSADKHTVFSYFSTKIFAASKTNDQF